MFIQFGDFEPDVAERNSGVAVVARNVFPVADGYIPVNSFQAYSGALSAAPKGLFLFQQVGGGFEQWAATATTIEQLVGTAWTDRSASHTFAVPSGEFVDATQFGPLAIFTNFADGPYAVNVDSGTNVAALGGSPPTARCIDVVNGHVMLGSTDDDAYGVAWSDTEDATNWSSGNSAAQSFKEGGRPRKICGAAGLVVQERGVTQITFQPGDSKVFSFDLIEAARGTIAPNSVIKHGRDIAYLAEDGFWFRGEPIGLEKTVRTFFKRADPVEIASVQGVADLVRPIFYWIYHTSSGSDVYLEGLLYNWHLRKWAEAQFDIKMLAVLATPGLSPDSWSVSPDSEPVSPDSRLFAGGSPIVSAFDSANKLAFADGTFLEATLETAEIDMGTALSSQMQMPDRDQRVLLQWARPAVDTTDAVMDIRYRRRLGDTPTYLSGEVSQTETGRCNFHKDARLFRYKVRVPSSTTWTYIKGVKVGAKLSGRR